MKRSSAGNDLAQQETETCESSADAIEGGDDLRFGPARELEMVVEGRHLEQALADAVGAFGGFVVGDLGDDRKGLDQEDGSDN